MVKNHCIGWCNYWLVRCSTTLVHVSNENYYFVSLQNSTSIFAYLCRYRRNICSFRHHHNKCGNRFQDFDMSNIRVKSFSADQLEREFSYDFLNEQRCLESLLLSQSWNMNKKILSAPWFPELRIGPDFIYKPKPNEPNRRTALLFCSQVPDAFLWYVKVGF